MGSPQMRGSAKYWHNPCVKGYRWNQRRQVPAGEPIRLIRAIRVLLHLEFNMLKATFDIIPENARQEEMQNSLLLMEVGDKVFSYVLYNKQQQRFLALRQYNLDFLPGKPVMEALQEVLAGDDLLQQVVGARLAAGHLHEIPVEPRGDGGVELAERARIAVAVPRHELTGVGHAADSGYTPKRRGGSISRTCFSCRWPTSACANVRAPTSGSIAAANKKGGPMTGPP